MTSLTAKERKILHYAQKIITRATLHFSCYNKKRAISEGGLYRRLPLDCSFGFSTSDHKWDRTFGSNFWPDCSPTAQNQHSWLMVSKCFGPLTVTVPHNWIYLYQKDEGWHNPTLSLKSQAVWNREVSELIIFVHCDLTSLFNFKLFL